MKALIVYGSTTGNTEKMASIIKQTLDKCGFETDMKEVIQAVPQDLKAGYDLLLLGCPAYGEDTIELQQDFEEFYEEMDSIELKGEKFAVFAPGDSSYENFCGSVDILEDKMKELGGEMVMDGLKIDGDPMDSRSEVVNWAKDIAEATIS